MVKLSMIDVVLDVEVANRNVTMVEIVSVDVVLIVRVQILRDFFLPELSFSTLKEIAIVGETIGFAKTEESPLSTQQFC
jgi:hypothetical protein